MDNLSVEMQNIREGLDAVKATQLIVQNQETEEHKKAAGDNFTGQVVFQKTTAIKTAIEENQQRIEACTQELKDF